MTVAKVFILSLDLEQSGTGGPYTVHGGNCEGEA